MQLVVAPPRLRDFVRAPSSEMRAVGLLLRSTVEDCQGSYVRLVGYWGIRPYGLAGPPERAALAHVARLKAFTMERYGVDLRFEFLFTDTHASCNWNSFEQIESYVNSVEQMTEGEHKVRLLSEVAPFERASSWFDARRRGLIDVARKVWARAPIRLRRRLIIGARRHTLCPDRALGLVNYLAATQTDRDLIVLSYSGYIFHSYSDSLYCPILPRMPILTLWTQRRGCVDKPWFS
jgi:hypothetical protein